MNNSKQAGITLAAQTDQFSVAPGNKLEIPLILTNEGSKPDQVRLRWRDSRWSGYLPSSK